MLNVKLERYLNTFWRKDEAKSFASLSELENWIFDQMQQDYSRNTWAMSFPTPASAMSSLFVTLPFLRAISIAAAPAGSNGLSGICGDYCLGMELPGVQRLMGLLLMLLGARGPGRLQGRPIQQEQGPGEQLP